MLLWTCWRHLGLFGLVVNTFPLQSQGDYVAQTVKAVLLIASAEIQAYHPFMITDRPVRTQLIENSKQNKHLNVMFSIFV